MKNIIVVFGGISQEHDVSVLTGVFTTNCVDKIIYRAVPVYIDKKGAWWTGDALKNVSFFKNIDFKKLQRVTLIDGDDGLYYLYHRKTIRAFDIACAINCLHGRNGEDGALAGLMQMHGIPFASPDVFSAAASMDKSNTKAVLSGLKIPVIPSVTVEKRDYYGDRKGLINRINEELGYPVIVKPCSSGSSIGISVARDENGLISALNKGFAFDERCLAEKYLVGADDINCAAYRYDGKIFVSDCERPRHSGDFLGFTDKYSSAKYGLQKEFPAKISESAAALIKQTTERVYKEFGFRGIIRVDYLLLGEKVYLNEINSSPGSLAYYLFCEKISDFSLLLNKMIKQGMEDHLSKTNCLYDFESDVLSFKGVRLKK